VVPGRQYSFALIRRLLWQRRWMIVLPFIVLSGGAFAFSYTLPNLYQAGATILLIPQRVPETYVRATVTTRLEERLRTVREQILTRPRLEGLIKELNLYSGESQTLLMEQLVEHMREQVVITPGREGSFRLSFTHGDPRLAAVVADRFAKMFIDENTKDRELQADSTSRFLDAQLEDAKRRLVEQEKKLEAYRRAHSGSLPNQFASNLQMIQANQQQLVAMSEATNRLRDRRLDLDRQIAQQHDAIQNAATAVPPPVILPAAPNAQAAAAAALAGTVTQQLEGKRKELAGLLLRLSPEHPDVRIARRQIVDLEERAREEAATAAAAAAAQTPRAAPVPVAAPPSAATVLAQNRLKEMQSQLASLDAQIAHNEEESQRLRGLITSYQGRIEELPSRESELTEITRDYATLQTSYQGMLAKREEAAVAANLERRQIGEQFRVVDPPRIPEVPVSPNRLMINAIGAVLGLLLGFGTAVVIELFDSTARTDMEIGAALGLPTLAMIPLVVTEQEKQRRTRRGRLEALAVTMVMLAAGAAAVWKFTAGN
jgi:polysaccharide chain length determinant protein (PEP-CTERM system associated)